MAIIVVLGLIPFVVMIVALVHPSERFLWGHRVAGQLLRGNGPYRQTMEVRIADQREPYSVRAAAVLSALLGGMIVPGGLAALVGVLFLFLGLDHGLPRNVEEWTLALVALSAPSGVVIAIRSLRLFGPMLRNELNVTRRMRSFVLHSGIHNAALVVIYANYALSDRADLGGVIWAVYPVISLIHVGLMWKAAASIERSRIENADADKALTQPGTLAVYSPTEPEAEPLPLPNAAPSINPV